MTGGFHNRRRRPPRGAPLSVQITGANVHDKWLADDLIISIVVPRPKANEVEQHICMDKGYDSRMCISLWSWSGISFILSIVAVAGNPSLRIVPYRVRPNFLPVVGWSNARLVGWRNVAVCVSAGVKKLITGWRLFNSPALTFSWTWRFTDRYLGLQATIGLKL